MIMLGIQQLFVVQVCWPMSSFFLKPKYHEICSVIVLKSIGREKSRC